MRPSTLSGVRNIVGVIISFTNRATDVVEKQYLRVDVTGSFHFLSPSCRHTTTDKPEGCVFQGGCKNDDAWIQCRDVAASVEFGLLPARLAAGSWPQPVRLAQDSCTCTSPDCTWWCPPPDPCAGLRGCALRRCICTHEPGCRLVADTRPPCFFHCFCP